jgi:U4/U6 small nuclear ribonucleoprotein PRP3
VFRLALGCLGGDNPLRRAKVRANVEELLLTGCAVLPDTPSIGACELVIGEGGPKAVNKFKKLMLRRMKWSDGAGGDAGPEPCALIWEGTIAQPNFKSFTLERQHKSELAIRKFLQPKNAESWWDLATATASRQ